MRWSRAVSAGLIAALIVVPSFSQDCPEFVGFAATPWCCAYDVAVSGRYAFVADGHHGLRVIDVSTPSSPVEVGFHDTTGIAYAVAVFASYALVTDCLVGLRVIDVSAPSSPVEVGFLETQESCGHGVSVAGSHAYFVDGYSLRVIDVSTPSSPIEVGFLETGHGAFDVAVSGSYAYVAGGHSDSGALRVIDISTPESPIEVGSFRIRVVYGVDVSGSHAYVAAASGLWVIDVSTPANPRRVAFFDFVGHAREVAVSGGHAFVVKDYYPPNPPIGLLVIDVSDPSSPVEVGAHDLDVALSVTVNGRYLYATEAEKGLDIFDPSGCPGFVPQPPAPRHPSGRVRP